MIRGCCRFCGLKLEHVFVDLGMSPLCESYVTEDHLNSMEAFYPLKVYVCERCFLVQLEEYVSPAEIFTEYAYFSSYSDSWLQHAKTYTDKMIERFHLGPRSQVVEIASNDGYLLQYFVERGIPVLGIEPAVNVAEAAIKKGISTVTLFFGQKAACELAVEDKMADLMIGNNVLAQVPDLNDFVRGMKILLKPKGLITLEFPHLLRMVEGNQFDTIYHEHFSYFSLMTVQKIFAAHGLLVFDVEELDTHGGSLRIYGRHNEDISEPVSKNVEELLAREEAAGMNQLDYYFTFASNVKETKRNLLTFLIEAKRSNKSVAGYGAPGKGNTLLNYCGIGTDFVDFTVDRSPYKQGKFLPGSHIPIFQPDKIKDTKPDYVLILPWNLKEEIMNQLGCVRDWGGRFVIPIPKLTIS